VDNARFGSHKDIFPTIFNLSLSNVVYFKSGNNLFGDNSSHYFSINEYNQAFDKNGSVQFGSTPIFFNWKGDKLIASTEKEKPKNVLLLKKAKAYAALLEHKIKKLLAQN
jgi:phosphoglycerol transferase MdoB-like AlkP superfamily enzyme